MAVGRTDSMHELITLMESLFPDTIIGSDINLVRHLFYFLKANEAEFQLYHEEKTYNVLVDEIRKSTVILYVDDFVPGAMRGKIIFEVINKLYTFEIVFTETTKEKITFRIPHELQSVQLRQNKRINCDDLFMNFIILYRTLEGGSRKVGNYFYSETRFHHLVHEIRKDAPNLELINLMIVDQIKKISKDFEIVMFHTTAEDNSSKHVRETLKKEKKTIYIADCNGINFYIKEMDFPEILTNYRNYYLEIQENTGPIEAMDFLADLQTEERRNFFVSYIYSPIVLYEEVIGYIKVYTTAMDKYHITENQALNLHEMSELVSYAFTKISIKEQKYDEFNVTTRIVDVSLSGLLFEIEDKKIYDYLKKHNVIRMIIPIGLHKLNIRAEIIRFIEKDGIFLLGVRYFATNPDDMLILENYIFERSSMLLSE